MVASQNIDDKEKQLENATKKIRECIEKKGLLDSGEEYQNRLEEFQDKFSLDALKNIPTDQILNFLFLHDKEKGNLSYNLEYGDIGYGSIKGGSAYKYKLFKDNNTSKWKSGSSNKQKILTDEEAIDKAITIRDTLVKGGEIVQSNPCLTIADYEKLDDDLNSILKNINMTTTSTWLHKYYHMLFPKKLPTFHKHKGFRDEFLTNLGVVPSEKSYGTSGQLALIAKKAEISTVLLDNTLFSCYSIFPPENCAKNVWLISPGENAKYNNIYEKDNLISVGWGKLGDLTSYQANSKKINKAVKIHYHDNHDSESNPTNVSKALLDFCNNMQIGDLVFTKLGRKKLINIGIIKSEYQFLDKPINADGDHNNIREVEWLKDNKEVDIHESINSLPLKTLTNVTYYDNYIFNLGKSFNLKINDYLCYETIFKIMSEGKKLYESYAQIVKKSYYSGKTPIKEIFKPDLTKFLANKTNEIDPSYKDEIVNLFNDYISGNNYIPENNYISVNTYDKADFLKEVVFKERNYDQLVELIKRKKNIILQGSPGVGKTFIAKRLAYSIMGTKDESRVEFVQFHQSYSYEDFIQGYRPKDDGFELNNGIFYNFCSKARDDPQNDYYFIIDEINRGNISKIFGELMMLIEEDKRGEEFAIHLTYDDEGEKFYVPKNVYFIGMMNTADRSLAMIDYALRRRFVFYLIPPLFDDDGKNDNLFKNHLISNNVNEELANKIINNFEKLNKTILDDEDLGYGFRIGHSYFCGKGEKDEQWYKSIIQYEIEPLLNEYWFDNLEKAEKEIENLKN